MSGETPETHTVIVSSPSKPRPTDTLAIAVADTLRRVENNYNREGSGPGSRFEGELLEDVQARTAIAMVRAWQAGPDLADATGKRVTLKLGEPQPAPELAAATAETPGRPLEIYRVRFEAVSQQALRKYSNADPLMYKNATQTVPNSQIPDEDWHEVTGHETDSPWAQYNQLRQWDAEDREFIRNVRLERLVAEPRWEAVDDHR